MFDNDIMNWSLEQPLHNDITSFSVSYPTIYNDGAREEDGVEEMEREPSFNAPPNPAVPRNNGRYPAFLSSTSSEPLGTAFDFGVDEPLQTFTPSSSGCDSCLTSPRMLKPHRCHLPLQSPAYTYPKSTALDSQCVRACTQIISGLENYLAADLRVLDLVLEVVKRAVEKLEQLIVLQQDSRCSRCMTLFATILHQIIELLETGCAAFLAERDHCNPAASAGFEKPNFLVSGSVFSGDLGFRAFAIDAEDQFQWKNRTVQKELRQAMKILQNFNDLSKIDGPQNVWNVHSSGCSPSELTLRFQSLYERVSGGGKFKEI
ncbi:hypothetical protein MMC11_004273 [Xylographa trunciseda]|nr:hypothetical protein [Xylographa trunciseda]